MEPGAIGPNIGNTRITSVLPALAEERETTLRGTWGYLIVVVLVILTYNCLFFNRYLPITEGWFSVYAKLINQGRVPYRDFYLFLPPAYPVLMSAFTAVFGYGFLALRMAGVVLMCVFSISLFGVLRSSFANWVAALVTIAMTIYYESGVAHISYDFVQVLTVSVLLSTNCLLKFARIREAEGAITFCSLRWALIAGILCGWAGMTKQSNGSVITVFCAVGVIVAGADESWRKAARGFVWFSMGVVGVISTFSVWLICTGAWMEFVRQVVVGAVAAKGTIGVILFAFLGHFFGYVLWAQLVYLAHFFWPSLIWSALVVLGFRGIWARDSVWSNRLMPLVLFLYAYSAILIPLFKPDFVSGNTPLGLVSLRNYLIPCAVVGTLLLGIVVFGVALVKRRREGVILVPILTALGLIWGNGTSAGLSETGVFLGLGLFLSVLLSHARWFAPIAIGVAGLLWLQMATWADAKYTQPYAWWGIKEASIRGSLVPAPADLQRGMLVGPGTAEVYKRVISVIERESKSGDRILVFPHTPVFYLLCDRQIMGRAVVEWFDFLPDGLARKEAQILRRDPPQLIVWLEMPEIVWATHERLFRAGNPLGQRAIKDAYVDLVTSGRMKEVDQVKVSEGFVFHFDRLQP